MLLYGAARIYQGMWKKKQFHLFEICWCNTLVIEKAKSVRQVSAGRSSLMTEHSLLEGYRTAMSHKKAEDINASSKQNTTLLSTKVPEIWQAILPIWCTVLQNECHQTDFVWKKVWCDTPFIAFSQRLYIMVDTVDSTNLIHLFFIIFFFCFQLQNMYENIMHYIKLFIISFTSM